MSLHVDVVPGQKQRGDLWQFHTVISSVRYHGPQIVQSGVQGAHAPSLARVNGQARAFGIECIRRTMVMVHPCQIRLEFFRCCSLRWNFSLWLFRDNTDETHTAGWQEAETGQTVSTRIHCFMEKKTATSTWMIEMSDVLPQYISTTTRGLATCPIKSGSEHKQAVFKHLVKAFHYSLSALRLMSQWWPLFVTVVEQNCHNAPVLRLKGL